MMIGEFVDWATVSFAIGFVVSVLVAGAWFFFFKREMIYMPGILLKSLIIGLIVALFFTVVAGFSVKVEKESNHSRGG